RPAGGGSIAAALPCRRSRQAWWARTIRSIVSPTRSSRRFRGYGATARSCPRRDGMSPARRGVGVAIRTVAVDVRAAVEVRRGEALDRQVPDGPRHVGLPDLGGERAAGDLSDPLDVEQR